MYPEHKSETGSFQELAHKDDLRFGQVSLLTINPGRTRGGHYHERKFEYFLLLKGECVFITKGVNVDINDRQINMEVKELYPCRPFEQHWLHNTGLETAELLVFASEVYKTYDPDTYREEKVENLYDSGD